MVNSRDPSNDRVPLRSHYSCHKAEKEQQPANCNFFRRDFPATLTLALGLSTKIARACSPLRWKNLRQQVSHTSPRTDLPSAIVPHAPARGFFSDRRISSPELPATDLQAYVPSFLIQHLHRPILSIFLSNGIYFQLLLDFSSKSDNSEAPLTIWSCFVPSKSTNSVDSVTLY